jgi:hypothetical protein
MLMVTDSAFTVFDAAPGFGLAGAALGGGAVFEELALCGGALCCGVLCPAATRLLANTSQAIRLLPIFSPIAYTLLRPHSPYARDEWGAVHRIDY